jgi:fatty acid desaturase
MTMATTPEPDENPMAELLKIEREREARRERLQRDIRGIVIGFLVVVILIVALIAYMANRSGGAPTLFG